MPLIGWTDPSHKASAKDDYTFRPPWYTNEELLELLYRCNAKYSPWTAELASVIMDQRQERTYFSSTMLAGGCPRSTVLERKVDYIDHLGRYYAATVGTLVHLGLEKYARPGSLAEVRFHTTIDGIAFSCSPDLVTPQGEMLDYKVSKSVPMFSHPWPSHTKQLQYNRFVCVAPETKILGADLLWYQAQDLKANQEIVGFDEDPRGSKFRTSKVLSAPIITAERYEVVTDRGSVVCTGEHQWLMTAYQKRTKGLNRRKGNLGRTWATTTQLLPGHAISFLVSPWEEDTSWGGGYLAGQFDGEGSFRSTYTNGGSCVTFSQNRGPDLDAVEALLVSRGFAPKRVPQGPSMVQLVVQNIPDIIALIGSIRPRRFVRHKDMRSLWENRGPQITKQAVVQEVRPLGMGPVVALRTDTRTFIAEGMLSHNCNNAEKWTKDGVAFDIPFDPRTLKFKGLSVVYLGDGSPKIITSETKVSYYTKAGELAKNKRTVPRIDTDEEVLADLRPRLDAMQKALDAFPEWPKGLERFWQGPASYECPGPPTCNLPCLAKRWPNGLTWNKAGVEGQRRWREAV